MARLPAVVADHLSVAERYSRSANLERDAQSSDSIDGYILTGRVLEMLDRIVSAADKGSGGAWSVTGPYGSGKSSLGVFLDALLGPSQAPAFGQAVELVKGVAPELASALVDLRRTSPDRGFARALVTAQAEPVTHTVLRGIERSVLGWFGRMPTVHEFPEVQLLKAALEDASSVDPRRTGPSPASLVEILTALAARSPVLMVIDEFGKNLEAAQQRSDADLYLLQLISEAAQTTRGVPIYLVTMQHLAFNEYASTADTLQQREWAKIQGRFEDVVFVDAAAQTRSLIRSAFTADDALAALLGPWSQFQSQRMAACGFDDLDDPDLLAGCYPLDPLALAALPELCRRYGQNERTLFSFLTGGDPLAVPALLTRLTLDEPLPTVGLPEVYDYFVSSAMSSGGAGASRWSEIGLRLRDVGGIDKDALRMAKSIAVLNLVATSGPLRASRSTLESSDDAAAAHLETLADLGVAVYRDSTDEYRIWQGTGLDLVRLIDRARHDAARRSLVGILRESAPLTPVVATGHAMRTDTLRTFQRAYLGDNEPIDALLPGSPFDGRAYLVLGERVSLPDVAPRGLPVVVQVPGSIDDLKRAAVEVHALKAVLADPAVNDDWVARTEVRERLADASAHLRNVLEDLSVTGTWLLLTDGGPQSLIAGPGSTALSNAADLCYPCAVAVRNETLNRVDLTSQGAKARRQLLLAMLSAAGVERLGLKGFGPEVAMYNSILEHTGMHRFHDRDKRFAILPPKDAKLRKAWDAVVGELERATDRRVSLADVHAVLQMPPFGMKAGVIPVLVVAVLIATSDEVAVYEHGTFRPLITEEVCDRMVKNPGHFEVKHFANANGVRREVVGALATALGVTPRFGRHRVGNVLAIVSELVTRVGSLPPYTMRAKDLSDRAQAVRDAVQAATEPDELLFAAIPNALGLGSVAPTKKKSRHVNELASRLVDALDELAGHYGRTLCDMRTELYDRARETGRAPIAAQARILEGEVLNPEIRSFVLALAVDDFDDDNWIEAIATGVTRAAPRLWTIEDRSRFSLELAGKLGAFRRLLALHNETRGPDAVGFDAHRFTFTTSKGDEDAMLLALDANGRSEVAQHLEPVVESLGRVFGSRERAEQQLLAWAAERVFTHLVTPSVQTEGPTSTPRAVNDA